MSNSIDTLTANGINVDKKRAENILSWLIRKEAENVRTQALSDVKMIQEIQKRIKDEVEFYSANN